MLSNDWYPAIQAPNVDLVSSGIEEVREHSVVDGDGVEREIDTLDLRHRLHAAPSCRSPSASAAATAARWPRCGTAARRPTWARPSTGFPNLFLLYGPNLNLGHTSIVYMLESQIAYAVDALQTMRGAAPPSSRCGRRSQAAYNEEIQERLAGSVWNTGGCGSWYFDRNGRNSIQWPGFTFEYRRRTRRFDAPRPTGWPRPTRRYFSAASAAPAA